MKRVLIGLAVGAVALVAGAVSYIHVYTLTLALHQPAVVALMMPVGVDGLVVAGSLVLLDGNALGWLGIGPGVAISLFANVASGLAFGVLSAAWAGIPAVSFALASFLLERWIKSQVTGSAALADAPDAFEPDAPSASADAFEPDAVDTPAPNAPSAFGPDERNSSGTNAASASRASAVKSLAGRAPRTRYRDLLAKGELPSVRAIQRDFQVGAPKARKIREELEKHRRPQLAAA